MDDDNELDTFDKLCLHALRIVDRLTQHPQQKREGHQDRAEAQPGEEREKRNSENVNDELHADPLV